MAAAVLIEPESIADAGDSIIIDCRFALTDPALGREQYQAGHIPDAFYLHLNEDLAAAPAQHGGRHPLPDPSIFAAKLASLGIGPDSRVIAYDDSRFAFCARLWWMMRSLGFRPPDLLNGGYQGWLAKGGEPEQSVPEAHGVSVKVGRRFVGHCDIEALKHAQARGALLLDSREAARYQGREEPIDPVAGHIPGALNTPWQSLTDDQGRLVSAEAQRQRLAEVLEADDILVYCGSGVTACVNLFALALLGREDARLYGGSWSDWCSYLDEA